MTENTQNAQLDQFVAANAPATAQGSNGVAQSAANGTDSDPVAVAIGNVMGGGNNSTESTAAADTDPTAAILDTRFEAMNTQMAAMQAAQTQQAQQFTEALGQLSGAITGLAQASAAPVEPEQTVAERIAGMIGGPLPEDQRAQFDKSMPVMEQVSRAEALKAVAESVAPEIDSLRAELKQRDEKIEQLSKGTQTQATSNMFAVLGSMIPNYEQAMRSPEFAEWNNAPNAAMMGMSPSIATTAAVNSTDAQALAKVLNAFLGSELGAKYKPNTGGMNAMPNTGTAAASGTTQPTQTPAQIMARLDELEQDMRSGRTDMTYEQYVEVLQGLQRDLAKSAPAG